MSEERKIKNDDEEEKLGNVLGASKDIKNLLKRINVVVKKVTQGSENLHSISPNILILGPRGTGKELVAKEIHDRISAIRNPLPVGSAGKEPDDKRTFKQKKVPFVPVNCAAIATDLFENEMFGHVKGAFTGAIRNKKGKVELAEGGILFLDEIGDLQLHHQAKFLRFLQEREFSRVGEEHVVRKVNVIVIAATNRFDLSAPSQDFFREDLRDRLNQHKIETSSLKHRYEDVVFYVSHFGKNKIDVPTKCLLYSYHYPGNVRELINLVGEDYQTVKRYIRRQLVQEARQLEIATDTNFLPEENSFWKPGFQKLNSQKTDGISSLRATFHFPEETSEKLEKWVRFYEIVTLWCYSTLSRDDLSKSLTLARGKLTSPEFENKFEEIYDYILPSRNDVDWRDEDDHDFARLPRRAMKLYPDFEDLFDFEMDE